MFVCFFNCTLLMFFRVIDKLMKRTDGAPNVKKWWYSLSITIAIGMTLVLLHNALHLRFNL